MLERFGALEVLTADADEWFEESGPLHYAEHLPELEAWIRAHRAERDAGRSGIRRARRARP